MAAPSGKTQQQKKRKIDKSNRSSEEKI